jgi:2,4-dienoyl-CoA reductase-like NADH-dependent reductase (Old Yellow Enzyme family)
MRLLEPIEVGSARVRNRVISAPMERNLCTPKGLMTPEYIGYLRARAAGGVGLVFTEASYVRIDGKGRHRQMGIDEDETVPGIAELADALHGEGALLGIELNHGGRTAQGKISGYQCVAPSPIPCEIAGGEEPLELDGEEILELIECYGEAARRCVEAGVDVISLHGAHGYLIHQFMSPRTNRREDEWADPLRFLDAVIVAVRERAPELPVGMRISAFEGPPDGLDADQTFELISASRLDLLDFIDVSAGSYEAGEWIVQPGEWSEGLLAEHAARYRSLGLPVSVAGRITRHETAERLLADGLTDMVSIGRALHADPQWVNAAAEGFEERPCIACNLCIDELKTGDPIPCSVNPEVGHEHIPAPAAAERPLRVAIAGAGPAGLEAARRLAELGHSVRLFEREPRVGGQFRLAASLHEYPSYHRIVDWYERRLDATGVQPRLDHEVGAERLLEEEPDAVVLATGAEGVLPPISGIDLPRVIEIREWLRRGKPVLAEGPHTVWGADREGVAVADELRGRGVPLLIVGGQHGLAPDVGRRAKILVVPRLEASPLVETVLHVSVAAIEEHRLLVVDPEGEQRWIPAPGPLLVSQGVSADSPLRRDLRRLAPDLRVEAIGEAGGQGGYIATAVADGARVARELHEDLALIPA